MLNGHIDELKKRDRRQRRSLFIIIFTEVIGMSLLDLQRALDRIPNVGTVNKLRRRAIIQQICELMAAEEEQHAT